MRIAQVLSVTFSCIFAVVLQARAEVPGPLPTPAQGPRPLPTLISTQDPDIMMPDGTPLGKSAVHISCDVTTEKFRRALELRFREAVKYKFGSKFPHVRALAILEDITEPRPEFQVGIQITSSDVLWPSGLIVEEIDGKPMPKLHGGISPKFDMSCYKFFKLHYVVSGLDANGKRFRVKSTDPAEVTLYGHWGLR